MRRNLNSVRFPRLIRRTCQSALENNRRLPLALDEQPLKSGANVPNRKDPDFKYEQ